MAVENAITHCDGTGGDSEAGEAIQWHAVGKGLRRKSWTVWDQAIWSGKDGVDFLLRTLKRIAARIPLETCSPGWNACAPHCNRALCA